MKQRIEKWWDSFVSLKWWVQAIIIVLITIGVHNYILHQGVTMPYHYGKGSHSKGMKKKGKKNKKKKKKK